MVSSARKRKWNIDDARFLALLACDFFSFLPDRSSVEFPMHFDVFIGKWIGNDIAEDLDDWFVSLELLFLRAAKLRLEVNVENAGRTRRRLSARVVYQGRMRRNNCVCVGGLPRGIKVVAQDALPLWVLNTALSSNRMESSRSLSFMPRDLRMHFTLRGGGWEIGNRCTANLKMFSQETARVTENERESMIQMKGKKLARE